MVTCVRWRLVGSTGRIALEQAPGLRVVAALVLACAVAASCHSDNPWNMGDGPGFAAPGPCSSGRRAPVPCRRSGPPVSAPSWCSGRGTRAPAG